VEITATWALTGDEVTGGFTVAALPKYTITVVADGNGTVTGGGVFWVDEEVTVSAEADAHNTFEGWFEDGQLVSSDADYTFVVTADRTLTAKFEVVPQYTIEVFANGNGNGAVSGGGLYWLDDEVTVVATVNPDSTFEGWFENGALVSAAAEYTFKATADRTLTARFALIPVVIKATPSAYVTQYPGNKNDLTITVTELYNTGAIITYTETFVINNNAAGTYKVGPYRVYVDTKGNTQIRECYIVW